AAAHYCLDPFGHVLGDSRFVLAIGEGNVKRGDGPGVLLVFVELYFVFKSRQSLTHGPYRDPVRYFGAHSPLKLTAEPRCAEGLRIQLLAGRNSYVVSTQESAVLLVQVLPPRHEGAVGATLGRSLAAGQRRQNTARPNSDEVVHQIMPEYAARVGNTGGPAARR